MSTGAHAVDMDPIQVEFSNQPDLKKPLGFPPYLRVPCCVLLIPCHDRGLGKIAVTDLKRNSKT